VGRVVAGRVVAVVGAGTTVDAGVGVARARDKQRVPPAEAVGVGENSGLAANKAAPRSLVAEDLVTVCIVLAGTGAEVGRESGLDRNEAAAALELEAGRRLEGCKPSPTSFRWSEQLLQQQWSLL